MAVETRTVIPSKWDVIPIHASDLATYMSCRRKWDWSSPARHNLRRRVQMYGVNPDLWFGTGIHYALEVYYNPTLQRDPVESFKTWYTWQVDGGIVIEEELDRVLDLEPQPIPSGMSGTSAFDALTGEEVPLTFKVRGLRELLPEFFADEWQALHDLGVGMMTFYRDYAKREDHFEVISAESVFSVPLGFEAIDTREDSPNYGKPLEVHARGKRDGIIRLYETNKYAIIDHKSSTRFDPEEFTAKMENDPQASTYLWASQEEARLNDLPYTTIEYVLYNFLRKAYPRPPGLTERGLPSLDRQKESTTAEMFEQLIKGNDAFQAIFEKNEKMQNYYTWLLEQGDKNFIIREYAYRNVHEAQATGEHIKMIATEMLNNPFIYPRPSDRWSCRRCAFRAPCLAHDDGSDWETILAEGYEKNRDR